MNIKEAITILKQQRDYWSYNFPDGINKRLLVGSTKRSHCSYGLSD